jgi:hypothetical protein
VSLGPGCTTYGQQRLSIPVLGTDALSQWVARLDTAMTGACR